MMKLSQAALPLVLLLTACGGGGGGGGSRDGGGGSGTHAACDAVTGSPSSCAAQRFATRDVCEAEFINGDFAGCESQVDAWVRCFATHDAADTGMACPGCEDQQLAVDTCFGR